MAGETHISQVSTDCNSLQALNGSHHATQESSPKKAPKPGTFRSKPHKTVNKTEENPGTDWYYNKEIEDKKPKVKFIKREKKKTESDDEQLLRIKFDRESLRIQKQECEENVPDEKS